MRHHPDALMLFAAGFGTRMGALTESLPKPLIKVNGRALIDHTLDLAAECAFVTKVANAHYLADQIETHLGQHNVHVIRENPDILETGGGLKNALPLLGPKPVVTSNTDAIWSGPNPFSLLLDAWDPERMDALMMCVPLEHCLGHSGSGDFIIAKDGRLIRGPESHVFGGIQIMKTDRLQRIQDACFSLNLVWTNMLADDRLFGVSYPGKWCDVGQPEGIHLAESMLRDQNV